MLGKKKEQTLTKGFIGGALPNERYTEDDLIKIQVLMDDLEFMVMIYIYNDKQDFDTKILVENFKHGGFNDEKVCRWCVMHGLKFKVVTGIIHWKLWKVLVYLHLKIAVKIYERQYQRHFIPEVEG